MARYGAWSWGLKDKITWSINAHILCSYDDVRKTRLKSDSIRSLFCHTWARGYSRLPEGGNKDSSSSGEVQGKCGRETTRSRAFGRKAEKRGKRPDGEWFPAKRGLPNRNGRHCGRGSGEEMAHLDAHLSISHAVVLSQSGALVDVLVRLKINNSPMKHTELGVTVKMGIPRF